MHEDGIELERLRARVTELEARNKLLLAAIEASPAGILIATAPDGTIRVWNRAALGIRGEEQDDLTEIPVDLHPLRWQTFHPDGTIYAPEDLPMSRALLTGEVVDGDDVIIRRSNGDERWVTGHAAPVRNEDGEIVAGVVVFPDITARKAAEAELARFRAMAEISTDFIGFATPTGECIYVNPGGRTMCGIEQEQELDGIGIERFHTSDSLPALFEVAMPTAIATGVWQGESTLCGPAGERIPVSQLVLSHRSAKGEVAYLSTIMRDLRPLRSLEAQLRQSQRLEAIGRLAGGIAHDFNNMLLVIENYVRFVLDTLTEDDVRHDDLSTALDACDRSARLCRQLLGFARQQVITPQIVDLNDIVVEFTKLIARLLGEDISLDVVLTPELWPVDIDITQFEQVLANLAVNARDAMPHGGRLTIETANTTLDEGHAQLRPGVEAGDYVMLAVSDTGTGIAKEDQERVFEPFFSTKGHGQGTGLGLATVHGAVKQNGGHIWLYSEVGQGTCFKILLPRAHASASEQAATPAHDRPRESPGGGETILVVEDEAMVRRLTVRMLLEAGYRVLEATGPTEALELVATHEGSLDLCVTDVVMPGMSGKQFTDKLAEQFPDIPVVYVSGYTENTIVHRGVLEPGVVFLAKPFTSEQLLARVRERLDAPRPQPND